MCIEIRPVGTSTFKAGVTVGFRIPSPASLGITECSNKEKCDIVLVTHFPEFASMQWDREVEPSDGEGDSRGKTVKMSGGLTDMSPLIIHRARPICTTRSHECHIYVWVADSGSAKSREFGLLVQTRPTSARNCLEEWKSEGDLEAVAKAYFTLEGLKKEIKKRCHALELGDNCVNKLEFFASVMYPGKITEVLQFQKADSLRLYKVKYFAAESVNDFNTETEAQVYPICLREHRTLYRPEHLSIQGPKPEKYCDYRFHPNLIEMQFKKTADGKWENNSRMTDKLMRPQA